MVMRKTALMRCCLSWIDLALALLLEWKGRLCGNIGGLFCLCGFAIGRGFLGSVGSMLWFCIKKMAAVVSVT